MGWNLPLFTEIDQMNKDLCVRNNQHIYLHFIPKNFWALRLVKVELPQVNLVIDGSIELKLPLLVASAA